MSSSKGVFESGVSCTRKHIFKASKLLYSSQSLKMRGINKVPDDLREVDEMVDVVIDLSDF